MSKLIKNIDKIKKPKRACHETFIHCSASDMDTESYRGTELSKMIDRWHKERGFDCIGYHYVIDKQGQLITGRDMERNPAAQKGHNTNSIAICVHGLHPHRFTDAQFSTLKALCIHLNEMYNKAMLFRGHCEVAAKSCPVFDYKLILKLGTDRRLGL